MAIGIPEGSLPISRFISSRKVSPGERWGKVSENGQNFRLYVRPLSSEAWLAGHAAWLGMLPGWACSLAGCAKGLVCWALALRPGRLSLVLRPGRLSLVLRPGRQGPVGWAWLARPRATPEVEGTDVRKISPFYKSLSPFGAAAQRK